MQPAPGETVLRMADHLIVGEPSGTMTERLQHLASTFAEAGIPVVTSDRIRQDIWFKLWGNMTLNPVSALTLATADRILDDPLVERLVVAVMEEARVVGARIGCTLRDSTADRNRVTRKLGVFKTSMLQDVEAGRGLELDTLLAAPREIAHRFGIETPMMDALFGLARLMGQSRGLYPL